MIRFTAGFVIARHVNASERYVLALRRTAPRMLRAIQLAIGGTISRLIQMFARLFSVEPMRLSVTAIRPRATNAYTTYRHYRTCRAWHRHDTAGEFSRCGEGVLQGLLLRYGMPVLQTAVNIVYWLPPPISQTLVTRSCRSPTANKPRAVIWRRCLPFLVPRMYLWRTLHFPSLRQQHVCVSQIEKALTNTRNSKLIRRGD